MCSVDGFTGNQPFTIEQFASYNQNRGPDATNYYKTPEVSIAHSLLAISPNVQMISQPIVEHKTGNVLAYNGEIYGVPGFDTEWLFDKINNESVARLKNNVNGMWAFAYYEPLKYTITLCRDHFGVKPLYYMVHDGELFFSSTPKPLYAVLNGLGKNVSFDKTGKRVFEENDRFLFGTTTPFKYIKKLGPGQILIWSLQKKEFIASDSMWGNDRSKFSLLTNLNWDPEELKELMVKCITEVGTAPGIKKAVSLSGGLDSTLIASINRNQDNLFCATMAYEERKNYWDTTNSKMFDESKLAIQTAKDYDLEIKVKTMPMDFNVHTQQAYWDLGVPMWDRNRIVPRHLNVLNAKENGAKIYMVGDLADELVSGYSGDFDYFRDSKPWLNREMFIKFGEVSKKYELMREYFPLHSFADDGINNKLFTRIMMHSDGFCTTIDHLCGAHGIESRVPFLHQELARYLMTIPSAIKLYVPFDVEPQQRNVYKGIYKYVFREFMKDYLPPHIIDRKNKAGFAAPWNSRNRQLNHMIGEEDLELVKTQSRKFYQIGVDLQPVFEYNDDSIVYNISNGEVEDG